MPISIVCSSCGKRLKARDELAGKLVPCPGCSHKLLIPEAEDDAAGYLLEPEPPSSPSRPAVPRSSAGEARPLERSASSPSAAKKPLPSTPAPLPPSSMNEPPVWLRHLHWLLILALVPLALSLLDSSEKVSRFQQVKEALQEAPPEVRERCIAFGETKGENLSPGELLAEIVKLLPEKRVEGALLARDSHAHWGFALGATVLFMAFFLLLASGKTAEPLHLLAIGLFTATIGILLLLLLQMLAMWSEGVWLRGRSIITVLFYIVKFIGFSYRAALEEDNGFFVSFLGFTFGVGFCEEVCKALPLLWYYRQRREHSWRTAFLWGLASGAGFGISEGISYAGSYYNGFNGAEIYIVRFISCVALHAVWTGSVAITLHLLQAMIQEELSWYEYIPRLFLIVGVPMVLHGLYDTLLKKDMSAGALVVAVLSFVFLAVLISRLHGVDDLEAKKAMLREYRRRRAALS